jgi:hypothetical protein
MSTPEQESEQDLIAGLIDGRLTPSDRERALRLLVQSEDAYDVFIESIRVQADLGDPKVLPLPTGRRVRWRRAWLAAAPALAAALLLIVVVPRWRERAAASDYPALPTRAFAGRGEDLRLALGQGWEQRDWSVSRGAASTAGAADSAISFRLGVRQVDLQTSLAIGDGPLANRIATEMLGWLRPMPLSESVASAYVEIQSMLDRGESRERLFEAEARADARSAAYLNSFWYAFGEWCAGADIAAKSNSAAFFQSPEMVRFVERVLRDGRLPSDEAATLRLVLEAARDGVTAEEFKTLRDMLRPLIKRHA